MVAEDLGVAGSSAAPRASARCTSPNDGSYLAELKFAEPAQGSCGRGIGHQTEVVGEGVFGLGVIVGAVAELAEIPPAVGPGRIEAQGLRVEIGGASNIAGLAGGVGIGFQLSKLPEKAAGRVGLRAVGGDGCRKGQCGEGVRDNPMTISASPSHDGAGH